MPVIVQCLGVVGHELSEDGEPVRWRFLEAYDPEFDHGRGRIRWTADVNDALRFADAAAATRLLDTVPRARPWRAPGKLNQPMHAYLTQITEAPTQPVGGVLR
jgi:hypothetical protein